MLLAAPSVATAAPEQPLPTANIVCGSVIDNYSSYNCSQGSAGMIRHKYWFTYSYLSGILIITETGWVTSGWVGNGAIAQPATQKPGVTDKTWEWNGGCGGTCAV
jgi:hypothetical protein